MIKESNETAIRLSDIVAAPFKLAKLILCIALIFAFLGAFWGAYKVFDAAKNPTVTEDDITAAEKAVKKAEDRITSAEKSLTKLYEIEIPDAETKLFRAQQLVQRRQEYINNSLYYAMNPFHRGISRVSLFVDTDTPINPSTPWMSVNPQSSIVIAATKIYPFDSDILSNIKRIMGTDADMQYINELVSVSNVSNQIIEIRVYHDDAEIAKQVTDYLLETLQTRLSKTVGEYSANVIGYFVGYEVDWSMNDSHNSQDDSLLSAERNVTNLEESLQKLKEDTRESREQAIEDAKTALEEAQDKLDEKKEQFSNTSAEPKTVVLKSAKNFVIFFFLGFFFTVLLVILFRIFNSKLQDINTVVARYSFSLVGVLPKKKKRWFDKTIRKFEGEPLIDFESAGKATAQNLISLIGNKNVAFVSSEGLKAIEEFIPFTNDRIPICGDIIRDAEAVKSATSFDGFILIESRGKSRIDMIDSEVRRIHSLGKEIEGIILL